MSISMDKLTVVKSVTSNSIVWNPTYEKISTCFFVAWIAIENSPSKFVTAPKLSVPLTCIVTPGSGNPWSSFTTPVTVLDCARIVRGSTKLQM